MAMQLGALPVPPLGGGWMAGPKTLPGSEGELIGELIPEIVEGRGKGHVPPRRVPTTHQPQNSRIDHCVLSIVCMPD